MIIQKYKPEFIFKFKNKVEINKHYFDEIKEMMNQSTDKKNFKVKVSKNISFNNNKWHRKRFLTDEEKIKKKINSLLNMYSKKNYKKVTIDILKVKINNTVNLEYLVNMIIYKYKNYYNDDIWNYLIEKIIFSNINKWKLDDKYVVQRLLNKVQDDFYKIIEYDYQETLENLINENMMNDYYKIKNKNIGLMKLICELFKYDLISKDLITFILENLTLDIKKYHKLELGISLVQNLYKYINNEEREKFIDFFSIYLKNTNLNKKVKFMILDFIENKEVKDKEANIDVEIEMNDDKIEAILKSEINDYIESKNILEFINNVKKYVLSDVVGSKFMYYFILYILENDNMDVCLFLINNFYEKKILNNKSINNGMTNFYDDYDDYKWDFVNINDVLKNIIIYLKEKKIVENNKFL